VPIQQAGMGAAAPPELAAAVSEAGALGMLGTARAGLNPSTFASLLERTHALTTRPFGVNFIMRTGSVAAQSPHEFIEQATGVARVVEFFYTDPNPEFVRIVHDHGALAAWQVGSREEALPLSMPPVISSWRRGSARADMCAAPSDCSICSARFSMR
jgi:nitronate monooxygenase